ncbi:MAG: sugar ABC transporter permease [Oscillospiraceae bacterium]|nr:sugar ABC transporter permease [Oscillospiraceae bacterium]
MRLTQVQRRTRAGICFLIPWLIGIVFFFIIPMCQSFWYSISEAEITDGGANFIYTGFEAYEHFFIEDSLFIRELVNSIGSMLLSVAAIMFFSLFMANILVQKFRGQLLARVIFFLPFIIASGMVISIIKGDVYSGDIMDTAQSSTLQITVLRNILLSINLDNNVINTIVTMFNTLFEITWKCGLQILIFMSGLQSISPSIKEASKIEGATGWEYFWKVAFPMITPMVQLCLVYSIIDSFTDYSNTIIKRIYELNNSFELASSSALAWIYYGIIFIIVGIAFLVMRKKIFYYND